MKRGVLPLNALRAFESTMRLGQMSLAAGELGVTYGAVSRQIRSLEERLGIPLFDGPRNKLVPTSTAQQMYPRLNDAFNAIEQSVRDAVQNSRKVVLVSCLSTFAMRWLIPRLFQFKQAYPEIEVQLTADDADVDFDRDRYDVAIRVGAGPWPNMQHTYLMPDDVGLVLSPSVAPLSAIRTLDDLAEVAPLHTKTRQHAWRDWCKQRGFTHPPRGQKFEHFYFLIEAATAGLGQAIAPKILVQSDVENGRLIAPFGFSHSGMDYVALTRSESTEEANIFVSWLVKQSKAVNDEV